MSEAGDRHDATDAERIEREQLMGERERLMSLENDNAALTAELTDRFRDQEEREHEIALTLKAGGFGTWSLGVETETLTSSDACKAIFGRPLDQPFSYAERLVTIHPDDRARSHAGASIRREPERLLCRVPDPARGRL